MRVFNSGVFRLFLAILVVLFHATRYFPFGNFAVNTFFILSGYWIFRMYEEYYSSQKKPYLTFIWSRVLRIYPLYYFCTFLAFVSIIINSKVLNHELIDFLSFNKLFSIITIVPYNYLDEKLLPPAWSLGIEMQFYFLAPLFIYLIRKINIKLFIIVILLISIFANFSHRIISLSVIPHLIFFVIGMTIWLYKPVISKKFLYISLFIIFLVIGIHYVVPFLRDAIFMKQTFIGSTNYMFFFYSLLPLFFIPLIIYGLAQKSDNFDRSLGDLSYTVYLFHWIPFSVYNYYFAESAVGIRLIGFISYLIILSIGSWAVYVLFEKKVEVLRKKILRKV